MKRIPFLLRARDAAAVDAARALGGAFAAACADGGVENFSLWRMEDYLFGYGESPSGAADCFDAILDALPEGLELLCAPGTMPQMYHDIGVVRADKSLIRHRVFATRLKPGCREEYKRRHDGLIAQRGDAVKQGPESNFTIWYGDGCIFGYCELVKAFDHEPTPEEHAATVAWETRQLQIMDWLTDDMNWLTGENHPPVEHIL